MIIAGQKQKENIAEYILYMYQIEDIIRAYHLDIDDILENYVRPQLPDESYITAYREWYTSMINEMKSRKIEKIGHLNVILETLVELSYLHNMLLSIANDSKYRDVYERAIPYIDEFQEKTNLKDKNHVELAFHALYMKLLLKIQKKEISAETEEAFDSMRMMLAYLSRSYKSMKSGNMDFLSN